MDNNTQMLLAHLKQTVIKFESGYALMTEARAELHKVAQNFKLEAIPLPEAYAQPVVATEESAVSFEVALWPSTAGGKLKASGSIDGTNYRVLLFEGTKEGVLLSGSIVPADAPEGSDLKDISMGYSMVRPLKDGSGNELVLKFTQLEDWFHGPLTRVVSDNPKAPAFKAEMTKSSGGGRSTKDNPLLNVLSQLEIPAAARMPTDAEDAATDAAADATLFAAPVAPPTATPNLADFFPQPAVTAPTAPPAEVAKPDPITAMFGSTAQMPDIQVPTWLLS